MKLRAVLKMLVCGADLPDERDDWYNIKPDGSYKVRLCFMSEDETWVETYPEHPILIPWYDSTVESFGPEGDVLEVFIDYDEYLKKKVLETGEWKGADEDEGGHPFGKNDHE